ncbi:hypothetical protein VB796_04860 [Arcicella sp. LKC2W]|uniref:hypothetical protein n=1 Tax=Arcicella sp. LKC2W TaxID=2984198 RepID=UPI002B218BFF|nr:hypothetical protein [Arcicella sp. LKC2W]MEA5458354.1 hypothetical protein [Arcicella sp. LKC2W]
MKSLKFTFVILALIILFYQIPNFISWFLGHSRFRHIQINHNLVELFFDVIGVIITLIFLLSITYKKIWDANTLKKTSSIIGFALCVIIVCFVTKEVYGNLRAIDKLYVYYKKNIGIAGNVFTVDDTLGHRGIPNGYGKATYSSKHAQINVPIKLNAEGFRIPEKIVTSKSDSLMMFLGCSFTWGDYVLAEQTYPTLTAQSLNYKSLNCGVDAYGLAQMLILAEQNIPKHQPKVLSVQYSPWLADRARFMFFPSAHGVMPFPFVTKNDKGDFYIHEPFFRSALYNPDYSIYKTTPASFSDKLSFIFKVGITVSMIDKWKRQVAQWKMLLGLLPTSEVDNQKIEKYVYERLYQLCKQYGVKMVVVNVGGFGYSDEQRMANHYDRKKFKETIKSEFARNITFIDADSVLRANIRPDENYSKYVHWEKTSKTDSAIYDNHPNVMAHQMMAKTFVKQLFGYQ